MIAVRSAREAQNTVRREAHDDPRFAFRCVCQALTVFRRLDRPGKMAFLGDAMSADGTRDAVDRRWDALLAGALASEAGKAGIPEGAYEYLTMDPRWIVERSWFYRPNPKTAGYLMANTPPELRHKGVFVDPGSLESV